MSIPIRCPSCACEFLVNESLSSRKVFCTQCGAACESTPLHPVLEENDTSEIVICDNDLIEVESDSDEENSPLDLGSLDLRDFPDPLSSATQPAGLQRETMFPVGTTASTVTRSSSKAASGKTDATSWLAGFDRRTVTAAAAGLGGFMTIALIAIVLLLWFRPDGEVGFLSDLNSNILGPSNPSSSESPKFVSAPTRTVGRFPAAKPSSEKFFPWEPMADSTGAPIASATDKKTKPQAVTKSENTLACMKQALVWVTFSLGSSHYQTTGFFYKTKGRPNQGMSGNIVAALPAGLSVPENHQVTWTQAAPSVLPTSKRLAQHRATIVSIDQEVGLMTLRTQLRTLPMSLDSKTFVTTDETETLTARGMSLAGTAKPEENDTDPIEIRISNIETRVSPLSNDPLDDGGQFVIAPENLPGNPAGAPLISSNGRLIGMVTNRKEATGIRVASVFDINRALHTFRRELGCHVFRRKNKGTDVFVSLRITTEARVKLHVMSAKSATIKRNNDGTFAAMSEKPLQSVEMRRKYRHPPRYGEFVTIEEPLDEVFLQCEMIVNKQSVFGKPKRVSIVQPIEINPDTSDPNQERGTLTVLPEMMSAFFPDPATGDVAAVSLDRRSIHLLKSKQLTEVAVNLPEIKFDADIVDCVFKRYKEKRFAFVTTAGKHTIEVIDVPTWRKIRSIRVTNSRIKSGRVVLFLATSENPDDRLLYYSTGHLYGIDVETMENIGFLCAHAGGGGCRSLRMGNGFMAKPFRNGGMAWTGVLR